MLRLLSGLLKFLVLGAVAALGLATLAVAFSILSLPGFDELKRSPQGQTVQVKAADGTLLVTLGPSYGEWLPYERIPERMTAAMISVEDRRFRSHIGIDPIGVAAAAKDYAAEGRMRGASTITQQLARNLFLTNERSFARKLREAVLALAIEQRFSKDEILELYLNRVYFGGGAYGIDAASRRFFGHPATSLSLEEAAIIAGLVKAPSRYAPTADPERARDRAGTVIAVMAETGAITSAEARAADFARLRFAPDPKATDVRYFTDWVMAELGGLTDETVEPLVVTTTLDPRMQTAAEAAIAAQTPAGAQGALVAMTRDGAVKALVGGRDYVQSNYNRAVAARRQPGSAFKLFVYLTALEDGAMPEDPHVDRPITIDGWSPKNSNGRFTGAVTLEQAFARSINTVAVTVAADAGFDRVAAMARRFGITTPIDERPAMALGSSEVTLLDMTSAFAAVAAGGNSVRPYGILEVRSGDRVLYERTPDEPRALVAPDVAARMTGLLKAAVETGTGRQAQMGRQLAGKTGTTSSNKDGYFVGFTSDLVAGVWMGRDDAKRVGGLAGGAAPARAFSAFMGRASRGRPAGALTTEVASGEGFIEPDAEAYGIGMDGDGAGMEDYPVEPMPDESAMGGPPGPEAPPAADGPRIDERWLDGVLGEEPADAPPPPDVRG